MFFTTQIGATAASGYGLFLVQTLAGLAVIALAAWAVVRFGGPRLRAGRRRGRMRVIERLPLEPRRSLYLVRVDGEELLVGASEGAVRLVREIGPAEPDPRA